MSLYTRQMASMLSTRHSLCPPFVSGYMKLMDIQKPDVRTLMSSHLSELMADAELYGWGAVHAFQAVWLQQMDQGRATWKDWDLKLTFHCALVWHQSAPSHKPAAVMLPARQPTKMTTPYNIMAKLGSKACMAYNKDGCTHAKQHPKDLQVWPIAW